MSYSDPLIQDARRVTQATVANSYALAKRLGGGQLGQSFFFDTNILQAEANGLSVCDAALAHVLATTRVAPTCHRATALLTTIAGALQPEEARNNCHAVHNAVHLMLDAIGCSSVVIWGTLYCSFKNRRAFVLNGESGAVPGQRPGHSWLISPCWNVADLALRYQVHMPRVYSAVHSLLPTALTCTARSTQDPEPEWWDLPPSNASRLDIQRYANGTKYHDVLGWTEVKVGDVVLRYLPGAVALSDTPLDLLGNVTIGGRAPADFLASVAGSLP